MLKDILAAPGRLLTTQTTQLSKAGRFAVFQIKMWSHCAKLLRLNRAGQQAAALAYHTIFGLVPLVIALLFIFQLFPTQKDIPERLKNFAYEQLHIVDIQVPDPNNENENILLTDYIDQIVGGFFEGVSSGSITIASFVVVLWAALALLSTVERAFNNIWHVGRGRNFVHRIINYWALLTLGPLLIGVGFYVSTQFALTKIVRRNIVGEGEGGFLSFLGPSLMLYAFIAAGLFLLYLILPNTKVRVRAAIWGAAVAALVWVVAQNIFGYYVGVWKPYSTVYGAMALVPISVLAIYITWLIVLFGLQLTYTTQHLNKLDAAEIAAARKRQQYFIANDLTVANVMREIAINFEAGGNPLPAEVLCARLNLPGELGEKILNHLTDSQLIVRTSEPMVGFVPARDPARISLAEVIEAVESASFAQRSREQDRIFDRIAHARKTALADCTLKEVLHEAAEPESNEEKTQ